MTAKDAVQKALKGFTLIELLIVIVIIGVLATTVLIALNPVEQRQKSLEGTAHTLVGKACQAIQACNVANSGGVCTTAPSVVAPITGNLPGGITQSGTASSAGVSLVAQAGSFSSTFTCDAVTGVVVCSGSCIVQ